AVGRLSEPAVPRAEVAALRQRASDAAGLPLVMASHADQASLAFARRADLAEISQQGPATPDHVIRTKRVAQLGRDPGEFRANYEQYFREHDGSKKLVMLDPAPRGVVASELGVL